MADEYWKEEHQLLEVRPDDIVPTTSPISEGTYLSQSDRRYQNRPRNGGQQSCKDCWDDEYLPFIVLYYLSLIEIIPMRRIKNGTA